VRRAGEQSGPVVSVWPDPAVKKSGGVRSTQQEGGGVFLWTVSEGVAADRFPPVYLGGAVKQKTKILSREPVSGKRERKNCADGSSWRANAVSTMHLKQMGEYRYGPNQRGRGSREGCHSRVGKKNRQGIAFLTWPFSKKKYTHQLGCLRSLFFVYSVPGMVGDIRQTC